MSDVSLQDAKDFCKALGLTFSRWDQENEPEKFWVTDGTTLNGWNEVSSSVQTEQVRKWRRGEIRALAYLKADKIRRTVRLPDGWTNKQVIFLDQFLRDCGILCEEQEIATIDFLPH
jgi:hypothetical protein